MDGWIRDYRRELESDIWLMPPLYHRVWQWIKYNVNHEGRLIPLKDGSKQKVERGQHMTSIRQIAKGVGWYEGRKWVEPNPKTIRSILKWMEQQGMITVTTFRGNNGYTLITVVNWEVYQPKNEKGNNKYPFEKQRTDINKNVLIDNDADDNTPATPPDAPPDQPPIPDAFSEELTEEEKLQKEICEYYELKRFGRPARPVDWDLIRTAIEEGFSREEMIAGINKAFAEAGEVNSFQYCLKCMRTLRKERERAAKVKAGRKVVPLKRQPEKPNQKLPAALEKQFGQQPLEQTRKPEQSEDTAARHAAIRAKIKHMNERFAEARKNREQLP